MGVLPVAVPIEEAAPCIKRTLRESLCFQSSTGWLKDLHSDGSFHIKVVTLKTNKIISKCYCVSVIRILWNYICNNLFFLVHFTLIFKTCILKFL